MKQSSYLLLNDLRVHYLYWNLSGAERPLVLLHGLASNARIWELTAPHLANAGHAVFAPDLRGHGLTDKPDGDYGFEPFARDLGAFLITLNLENPILIGHSWGAMLALDYAARISVGPRAPSGLVLVDGGATQLDEAGLTWEEMRQRLTPPRLAGLPLESFLERLNASNPHWQPDDAAIQIILANFEVTQDETIAPHLTFVNHMRIVHAMWEFKTYERFGRVKCPVLILPARPAAPASPADAAYLAYKEAGVQRARAAIADLQVHWMEDSIHDIPLQRPADLAERLVDFARSVGQPRR